MRFRRSLQPQASDYLYFMADVKGDGTVYYAKTYAEHQANVRKYLENKRQSEEVREDEAVIDRHRWRQRASGKTTIAQCLKAEFEQTRSVVIIREDDYYKDQSQKTMAERVKIEL